MVRDVAPSADRRGGSAGATLQRGYCLPGTRASKLANCLVVGIPICIAPSDRPEYCGSAAGFELGAFTRAYDPAIKGAADLLIFGIAGRKLVRVARIQKHD